MSKKGGYVAMGADGLPHNWTTGWYDASQPAPVDVSLSYGVEKREFSLPTNDMLQLGGGKVKVKGVGIRKVRYYKNGNKYVLVNGKKKKM